MSITDIMRAQMKKIIKCVDCALAKGEKDAPFAKNRVRIPITPKTNMEKTM